VFLSVSCADPSFSADKVVTLLPWETYEEQKSILSQVGPCGSVYRTEGQVCQTTR
jgi:hypothetical protein